MQQRFVGEIEGFTPQPFLDAAELLARSDEPERALLILDNLPARYRDAIPLEVETLRLDILSSLITPHAYASVDFDSKVNLETCDQVLKSLARGNVASSLLEKLNQEGKSPHLIDMGPGEYWLPLGLYKLGFNFTYHDVSLLRRTGVEARALIPEAKIWQETPPANQPVIFIAFELIEHLSHTKELTVEALRHGGKSPDYVLLSTPMYTFDGSKNKVWRERNGSPHLRAYTPGEFFNEANKLFPRYDWEITHDAVMVLKGIRRGN